MATESLYGVFSNIWVWIESFLKKFIPNYIMPNIQFIIQVVILLFIAWIFGRVAKFAVIKVLNVTGLKRITTRSWAEDVLKVTGYKGTVVELIGDLVKWLIYILFIAIIIQLAGLPGIADIFSQMAIVMPRIIGAIFIIVIGFIIADFFSKIFEEAALKIFREELASTFIGGIIKYAIAIVSLIMALSMVGVDTASLNIMFAILMIAVVAILLFGLRDIIPNFSSGMQVKSMIKVGESIKVGEWSGVVEKINPTTTTLKDGKATIVVPNSYFTKFPVIRTK